MLIVLAYPIPRCVFVECAVASISSLAASSVARPSPRDLLQQQLSAEISTGKVKAADKSALSSAIDTIDSSIRSQQSSGSQSTSSAERGRGKSLKDTVASLIQQQVDSGALTADQASELKQVFADTFAKSGGPSGPPPEGGPEGAGGPGGRKGPPPGGPGGAGGPPPPKKDDSDDTSVTSTSSTDTIAALLKKLQESIDRAQTYSAVGSGKSTNTSKALLIDVSA
jgi:hypothetical protein